MMRLKRFVIRAMEWTCGVLDNVPLPYYCRDNGAGRWIMSRCWGCWPFRLTEHAWALDQKWGTGVWCDGATRDDSPLGRALDDNDTPDPDEVCTYYGCERYGRIWAVVDDCPVHLDGSETEGN